MDITYRSYKDVLIFTISGSKGTIAASGVELFIKYIMKINNSEYKKIAFDLSEMSSLSSSSLGELVVIKDKLLDRGIQLILLNPTEKVESLINMVGLDEFFRIVSTEEDL